MSYLDGMIPNRGYGGNCEWDYFLHPATDMRPVDEIHVGDNVCCPGVGCCQRGVVVMIDADNRLARVSWESWKYGWWYLKDLRVIGYKIQNVVRAQHAAPLQEATSLRERAYGSTPLQDHNQFALQEVD
jgi:hypothetical protein